MTNKEIKAVMEDYYKALIERNDNSYNELYKAFYTMQAARLIDRKQWNFIVKMDNELFSRYS